MTTTPLITNRYGQATPTTIQDNGCAISCPFYINPTSDQTKQLLNAFRRIKTQQLIELGFNTETTSKSGIVVDTAVKPPTTPIEEELGMNEEALRYVLFGRQGIQERLFIKLQRLTGVYLITRQQVVDTYTKWLDTLYGDDQSPVSTASTITETKQTRKKETAKVAC
jgi:hypothetical protein